MGKNLQKIYGVYEKACSAASYDLFIMSSLLRSDLNRVFKIRIFL